MTVTLGTGLLRDGDYTGVWQSYEVTVDQAPSVVIAVRDGVRGRMPVTIVVRDGQAEIELVEVVQFELVEVVQ